MVFVPLAFVGALGANFMAAKDLDEVASIERARRPLSDFVCGGLLGAILGLWTGVNYAETIRNAWSGFEQLASWISPAIASLSGGPEDRPPKGPQGQATQGAGPPVVYAAPGYSVIQQQ
eukprot:TRINITY_DN34435_c0_g1_i1.p1 TRINITY_DN34435_c0_g1~~TRINITY_DN34435_c0_g1_i1.p1  ORF type:complete len:119 (+),score=1.59 TRINITY_DN34435_c0_g1_i1:131-487(+)